MLQRALKLTGRITLWFFVVTIAWVLIYRIVPVPVTMTMIANSISNIGSDDPVRWKKDWVSLDKISNSMQMAVVASEDQKFAAHNGFDLEAIKKAFKHNEKGRSIKGGSTISQQTAKNAFLWQGRSWIRKGLEAYFTVLIELLWGKQRIMEVYLNVAEMGNGIYGAQAAAQEFFNKDAARLNDSEAALLAAVLPSPKRYSAKNPGPYVRKRQQWIKRQMRNLRGVQLYD